MGMLRPFLDTTLWSPHNGTANGVEVNADHARERQVRTDREAKAYRPDGIDTVLD